MNIVDENLLKPGEDAAIGASGFFKAYNRTQNSELASKVELAGTGATRSKGLLGRKGLPPGEALWIVPCEAVHTFWMQFSLDLVYLDRENRVRKIRRHVPPWRLSACLTAHSVLEFSAGSVGEELAQPGDQIEFAPRQESLSNGGD